MIKATRVDTAIFEHSFYSAAYLLNLAAASRLSVRIGEHVFFQTYNKRWSLRSDLSPLVTRQFHRASLNDPGFDFGVPLVESVVCPPIPNRNDAILRAASTVAHYVDNGSTQGLRPILALASLEPAGTGLILLLQRGYQDSGVLATRSIQQQIESHLFASIGSDRTLTEILSDEQFPRLLRWAVANYEVPSLTPSKASLGSIDFGIFEYDRSVGSCVTSDRDPRSTVTNESDGARR